MNTGGSCCRPSVNSTAGPAPTSAVCTPHSHAAGCATKPVSRGQASACLASAWRLTREQFIAGRTSFSAGKAVVAGGAEPPQHRRLATVIGRGGTGQSRRPPPGGSRDPGDLLRRAHVCPPRRRAVGRAAVGGPSPRPPPLSPPSPSTSSRLASGDAKKGTYWGNKVGAALWLFRGGQRHRRGRQGRSAVCATITDATQ